MQKEKQLKRKLYGRLLKWKIESCGSTALMINGAGRVGKSFICKQFAQNEYESHIIIDFGNVPIDIQDLFLNETSNLDLFFLKLSAFYGVTLKERKSLIIFDEVQQLPKARQLIKYLVADGRYAYIETGSLIRLKKNARFRTYEDSFIWLNEAMIVNACYNATDPTVALALSADHATQKCYMADTGLMITQSLKNDIFTENEVYKAVLFDKLEINEGMIMENAVAQMLRSTGHNLYFYSRSDAQTA